MFKASVYTKRRERLKEQIGSGIALFPGNVDAAFNYPANPYHFRQDSNFLYFFGLDHASMAGIVDADTGEDWVFANDIDIEDIIWMGELPTVKDLAAQAGIVNTAPYSKLAGYIRTPFGMARSRFSWAVGFLDSVLTPTERRVH